MPPYYLKKTKKQPACELFLILLKHGAALQRFSSRAVLEDVVIETSELLSHVLGSLPSCSPVLHRKQLGAQVVEPQHVGMGVVVTPVITETDRRKEKINKTWAQSFWDVSLILWMSRMIRQNVSEWEIKGISMMGKLHFCIPFIEHP